MTEKQTYRFADGNQQTERVNRFELIIFAVFALYCICGICTWISNGSIYSCDICYLNWSSDCHGTYVPALETK